MLPCNEAGPVFLSVWCVMDFQGQAYHFLLIVLFPTHAVTPLYPCTPAPCVYPPPWQLNITETHRHIYVYIYIFTHATQRLPAAAGVSERQKWPIFSPFHLNNKQGLVLKWAKDSRREIGLIRVIVNQEGSGLADAGAGRGGGVTVHEQ